MNPSPQRGSGQRGIGVNALPIGARIGDHEIAGIVRHGPFSIVYACAERGKGRRIAVKEYLPALLADRMSDGSVVVRSLRHQDSFRAGLRAFLDEAQRLAAIERPALVKVLRFWEEHGTAYMAMPLYEGRTLKDALRDGPRPTELELKSLVAPILDALATLHAAKAWPRDVSPDNVIVREDGSAVLLDYGAARRAIARVSDDVAPGLEPGFTPIEQYGHDPQMTVGPWTDVYALAAVLYFAITGKPPPSPQARLVAEAMKPLVDVATGYTESFLVAIDRGLAVRPKHRPEDIAAFRSALGIATVTTIGRQRRSGGADRGAGAEGGRARAVTAGERADEGTRVAVLREGSRRDAPELVLPPAPRDAAASAGIGSARWKIAASAIAVAALAAVAFFEFTPGAPKPPPQAVERAEATAGPSATGAARSMAEESGRGAEAAAPGAPPAPSLPQAATEGRADGGSRATGADATGNAAAPAGVVAANAAVAAPRTAKLRFSIKPWGEIFVDGRSRGLSPPVKELVVSEGTHRVEVRNGTFAGYANDVDAKAGASLSIAHTFGAAP